MTDQMPVDAVPVDETPVDGVPDETTSYVVLAAHSEMTSEEAGGRSATLWREIDIIDVPKKTKIATVLQSAGERVQQTMGVDAPPVRFKVWPLGSQADGQAALVQMPPQLEVTAL